MIPIAHGIKAYLLMLIGERFEYALPVLPHLTAPITHEASRLRHETLM